MAVEASGASHSKNLANSVYRPLNGVSTRLIQILTPTRGEEHRLTIRLQAVSFDELGDSVYAALSYHWGSIEGLLPVHVLIPGAGCYGDETIPQYQQLYIRPNLHAALTRLRSQDSSLLLWADALCINQDDTNERTDQVSHMALIYSRAVHVYIWLGQGDERTDNACDFILDQVADIQVVDSLVSSRASNVVQGWEDIMHLLQAGWFYRRWIIQELALARDATILCGTRRMPVTALHDAMVTLSAEFDTIRQGFNDDRYMPRSGWADKTLPPSAATLIATVSGLFKPGSSFNKYQRQPAHSLEYLVCTLSWSLASDPRDTVTAFLSIAKESFRASAAESVAVYSGPVLKAPPKTDYRDHMLQCYVNFVRWIQQTTGCIDIICRRWAMTGPGVNGPIQVQVELPSWIRTRYTLDDNTYLYRDRAQANSFVGLPGTGMYAACADQKAPNMLFGVDLGVQLQRCSETISPVVCCDTPAVIKQLHSAGIDASIVAKGIVVGTVDFASEPMTEGILTKKSLQKLFDSPHSKSLPRHSHKTFDRVAQTLIAERWRDGRALPPRYVQALRYIIQAHGSPDEIDTKQLLQQSSLPKAVRAYVERMRSVIWNRCHIEIKPVGPELDFENEEDWIFTHRGLLHGFGHSTVRKGDVVCILFGCSVPVVLRQCFDTQVGYYFTLVGGAYIYGIMDGQFLPTDPVELGAATKDFRIF